MATRLADRRRPGVLHGNRTYLLQDEDGQIKKAIRSRPASTIPASGRSIPG
jgi:tryptophan synthase beta subunit